MSQERQL